MNARRDGFTLIELLIVVVIIGILASIAIPKWSAVRERAYLASIKSDLKNLATLQDVYHNGNYTYSTSFADLDFGTSDGIILLIGDAAGTGWSASATHQGLPGEVCAMYRGGSLPVAPATVESVIMCTR